MIRVIADRFVRATNAWVDLGTGLIVRLRAVALASAPEQLQWDMRCTTIARLRHPMLNRLMDYGSIGQSRFFEAYSCDAPLRLTTGMADRLMAHATRFLSDNGIALDKHDMDTLVRPIERGRSACPRPIGVVLQHRPIYETIVDALDARWPPGPCAITIEGPPGSGVRTLRLIAARAARLHGYAPVDAAMFALFPWLADHLAARHVCLLADATSLSDALLGSLLVQLGAHGARRHVLLMFGWRKSADLTKRVPVERMGVAAMTGMVFLDREQGPMPDDVLTAVRLADGRPGPCIERLGAGSYEPIQPRLSLVHEAPQSYETGSVPPLRTSAVREHRLSTVLRRSLDRGEALVQRGRHLSAERVLTRAIRLLGGRGAMEALAEASLRLGFLALQRGHIDRATSAFEGARKASNVAAARAAVGLGLAWIEDGRLTEAEAILRTAVIVADDPIKLQAACALAKCLCWMGRLDEATLVVEAAPTIAGSSHLARLLSRRARIQLAEGRIPLAVRTARSAVDLAVELNSPAVLASSYRILAMALASAGDERGAATNIRNGLLVAARAHLPLAAARLRLTRADIQGRTRDSNARRLAKRIIARNYPPLVRAFARAVLARLDGTPTDSLLEAFIASSGAVLLERPSIATPANPVAELESFLDLGHTAPDDYSALERIAASLQTQLRATSVVVVGVVPDRRIFSVAGRPWHGDPHVAWRAAGAGTTMAVDPAIEPAEAAEPIRYCGEVIGAIAMRWTAGVSVDATRTASIARVASLALAPNVRALIDRSLIPAAAPSSDDLLGESEAARALRESITKAARAPYPVLIQGESGSGKELVARAIHRLGSRRDRRFCALNCAALSDELVEAELFGHARGAFTGAVGERAGLFEDADGGTLFLDEIGELSARAQAKLLRVLQDGEVRRVGESLSRRVDVRIIAATNRRLEQEAAAGRFRADLRFRLDVVRIEVPPLRERASDVPLLASRFWHEAAGRVGSKATLAPDAVAALARYEWPGNVRELQNVIAWVAVQSPRRGRIGPSALPAHVAQAGVPMDTSFDAARQAFERRFVKAALATADGQRARAARALGVTRQGLAKMMRRLGIE